MTYIVRLAGSRRAEMSAFAGWSKWLSSAAACLRADRPARLRARHGRQGKKLEAFLPF